MPSTKVDIQVGSIFRPRMSGTKCVKMRPGDTVTILAYTAPDVLVEYTDGYQFIVEDNILLAEYKLKVSATVSVKPVAVQPPTPAASVSSQNKYDQVPYTVGSKWTVFIEASGKDHVLTIVQHDKTGIVYSDAADFPLRTYVTSLATFKNGTKPYSAHAVGNVVAPVNTPYVAKTKPSCPHKHTAWYGDVKSCTNCGDTLGTLQSSNPYNVDPDLKTIPSSVSAFLNRYGQTHT